MDWSGLERGHKEAERFRSRQEGVEMFSIRQKREIAEAVQRILRSTNHPELPKDGEITFSLHVDGAESSSWADL